MLAPIRERLCSGSLAPLCAERCGERLTKFRLASRNEVREQLGSSLIGEHGSPIRSLNHTEQNHERSYDENVTTPEAVCRGTVLSPSSSVSTGGASVAPMRFQE
jgi:hypothetical protein